MAINLQKGQRINVGLTHLTIGLGRDSNKGTAQDFELDASAFMLDNRRQIPSETFFIFYGNADSPDGALHHTGDVPTDGNSVTGDDESIEINLTKVDQSFNEILFVTIHEATNRRAELWAGLQLLHKNYR